GGAYAVLVLRAAPHRRDNLTFGKLALLDAVIAGWRALNLLAGESLAHSAMNLPCGIGTAGLALLTMEFIWAFPRRPSMAWRYRALLLLWAAAGVALMFLDSYRLTPFRISQWFFFTPVTLLIFAMGWRSWRLTPDRNAHTVIAMLWLRWGFGFIV